MMTATRICSALFVCLCIGLSSDCFGEVISTGADGPFHPSGSVTLNLPPDGIFNFTTINIPEGATVTFNRNALNTPVYLAATGDVTINGTLSVSAGEFGRLGGPGGCEGGIAGGGTQVNGTAGGGLGGGEGGLGRSGYKELGHAGGGGGMATPGLQATSRTGSPPGEGGPALSLSDPLTGGSGGGGGGRGRCFDVNLDGGDGGGGGGALELSALGDVNIGGAMLTNGAHGGWSFANVFAFGGPGGGGSGGVVDVYGNAITVQASALLQARGGAGGGLSTEPVAWDPFLYSCGANGGQGYFRFHGTALNIHPSATIDATVIPEPSALLLLGLGAVVLLGYARRRRGTATNPAEPRRSG